MYKYKRFYVKYLDKDQQSPKVTELYGVLTITWRGNVVLDKQARNEQWDRANGADREHAVGGRFVWTSRRRRRSSGTRPIAGAGGVGRVRAIQTDGISLEGWSHVSVRYYTWEI